MQTQMLRQASILIFAAIWTSFAFANDVCHRVFEQTRRAGQHTTDNLNSRDALTHFQYALSTPLVDAIASYGEGATNSGTRNLIVILPSTKPRHELSPVELEIFTAFKAEYERFGALKALLHSFLDKRTEEACRKAMQEARFDYDAFCELASRLSADIVSRSFVEGEFLVGAINALRPRLKRSWEIARGFSAEELLWLLNAPDLRHVVIVAHGDDDGQMRDFQQDLLALDTFYYLPPSIESLTFYSCYSMSAVDVYQVRELFTWMPNIGKDRRIFYVKPQRIDGMDSVALMGLFGHFLSAVDHQL